MPGEGPGHCARRALQGTDAAAICEAASRPQMRFVPIKTALQQGLMALHCITPESSLPRRALEDAMTGQTGSW